MKILKYKDEKKKLNLKRKIYELKQYASYLSFLQVKTF